MTVIDYGAGTFNATARHSIKSVHRVGPASE
jgi:hypothetical protein